jgi:chondroitin 4-sulfotransferase 11
MNRFVARKLWEKLFYRIFSSQWNDPRGVISHRYKFIYLPIAKVANTSLKEWILSVGAIGLVDKEELICNHGPAVIRNFNKDDYCGYYKFAFVRNPWSRLVSCYSNKILKEKTENRWFKEGVFVSLCHYGLFKAGMPFSDFVRAVCRISDKIADDHFKSQHCFLEPLPNL